MFNYRFIGSFNTKHLERWVLEHKQRFFNTWKIAGHSIILFHKTEPPVVYKSLADIHVDSISDLKNKFPNRFFFIVVLDSLTLYSKPQHIDLIYPTKSLENNLEIPKFQILKDSEGNLKFNIDSIHYANEQTFSSENIYLEKTDKITDTHDSLLINFDKNTVESSIISYTDIANPICE